MVARTVLQKSVLQCCRIKVLKSEHVKFSFRSLFFCNTAILFSGFCAQARDLGTHGVIYPIKEQDPIVLIQQKLKMMEESGELERRNLELQKKTRASIERPETVKGITKAIESRVFYFDPTYVVKKDLYDHLGQRFAQKGERINPLETVSLSQNLVFFNGDDEGQLAWVKEQLGHGKEAKPLTLILINGAPLTLAEDLRIPVYFDQGGLLMRKLGIMHVPAVVSQERLQLKIEEIKMPPSREHKMEGEQ